MIDARGSATVVQGLPRCPLKPQRRLRSYGFGAPRAWTTCFLTAVEAIQ